MSRSWRITLFSFFIGTSILLLVLIFSNWLPWMRGPAPETSEWYWPYLIRPIQRWWPSIISAIIMFIGAVWWLKPAVSNKGRDAWAITILFLSSILLQLALIYADRAGISAELIDRTQSNLASGFFEPAAEVEGLNELLGNYPQAMESFTSEHARTHPPGLISANWLTIQLFKRLPGISEQIARKVWPLRCMDLWLLDRPPEVAAALGFWSIFPVIAAAISILPGYGLARLLLGNKTARLAAIFTATIPALLLFSPKSVQLYAPLTLLAVWLFQIAISRRSTAWISSAGVVVSISSFLSLGNAALFLLLLFYGTFSLFKWPPGPETEQRGNYKLNKTWQLILGFAAGAASVWLFYWAFWGVPPWSIAQTGMRQHYELVTNLRRYDWWVIWNLIDLVIFSGWPMILGFIGSLFLAASMWRHKKFLPVDLLAVFLLLLILAINFSGSSRGEVGRLWLFFMPLLAYPAASFWKMSFRWNYSTYLLVGIQLALVVTLGLAWKPVRAVIVVAERPIMPALVPEQKLTAKFSSEPFTIEGFSTTPETISIGDDLSLTLFWKSSGPASRPYTVFNHLINETGAIIAQQDNWPVNGRWPPTCWRAGEQIVDSYTISITDPLPPGNYTLITGLYDQQNGKRLSLEDGRDNLQLKQFTITKE